jgi:hypothetical protein
MKLRHGGQVLSLALVVTACGASEAQVVQPPGCVNGLERVPEAPVAGDVRVGRAWLPALDDAQRRPWREHWNRDARAAFFKVGAMIPAGGTLELSVPDEARGLLALDYAEDRRVAQSVTLSACHGHYPVVFIPGALRVRRPICRVPLDWRYGDQRGRLHLTFGRACR